MSWSFQKTSNVGPKKWGNNYSNCSSDSQSPININSTLVKRCNVLCNLNIKYRKSKCRMVIKNNIPYLLYDKGSFIEYKKVKYNLYQIAIHTPGLHTIDNVKYPMELNLYHKSLDGSTIIISLLVDDNDRFSSSQDFFNQFAPSVKNIENKIFSISTDKNWSINQVLPTDKEFYLYKGSLPHPPCDEDIVWIILKTPINIERKNLKLLKKIIRNNYNSRSLQKLNNRQVYCNLNENNTENNTNNIKQVYVQCKRVNVNELDNIDEQQEELEYTKKKTKSKTKYNKPEPQKNKQTTIGILIIIVCALLGCGVSLLVPIKMLERLIIKLYKNLYIIVDKR